MRRLLLCLMLAGCEHVDEQPIEFTCEMACKHCEEAILECGGTGRGVKTKKVNKP